MNEEELKKAISIANIEARDLVNAEVQQGSPPAIALHKFLFATILCAYSVEEGVVSKENLQEILDHLWDYAASVSAKTMSANDPN